MHYTTLVIGAQGEDEVREALAPYMENCCGVPDKRFMEFYDIEDELREDYEKGVIDRVVMPDGRLLDPCDDEFSVPWQDQNSSKPGIEIYVRAIPEGLETRKVSSKQVYKTFEDFATAQCGDGRDSTYNRYGFWQNPNAKWDWYVIGGRWSPCFQLKEGRKGLIGQPGIFGRNQSTAGRADQALKGDIDFEAMCSEDARAAANTYDVVNDAIRGTPINESWEVMSAFYADDAEKKYREQPRVKAFIKFAQTEKGKELLGYNAVVDQFNMTRAEYIQQKRNGAIATTAVVMNGKWYDSHGKDDQTWHSMFTNIIDQLPDDEVLTVVDCHI